MSRHDIVSVVRVVDDTRLWVERTIEPSGHWTIRVLPTNPSGLEEVANEFRTLGCHSYATPFSLVAVDVPPDASVPNIMKTLQDGREANRWDFDLGVLPPTSNSDFEEKKNGTSRVGP